MRSSILVISLASLLLAPLAACDDKGSESGDAPTKAAAPSAAPEAKPSPAAAPSKVPDSFTGVSVELKIGDRSETLALSDASLAARGEGPMAVFSCEPATGHVGITDFGIGDDASRKGELFVVGLAPEGIVQIRPGASIPAKLALRRAGEPTPTNYTGGTMTWDEGFTGGTASVTTDDGVAVELRWTCEPKPE
jgi:hypothetical protein